MDRAIEFAIQQMGRIARQAQAAHDQEKRRQSGAARQLERGKMFGGADRIHHHHEQRGRASDREDRRPKRSQPRDQRLPGKGAKDKAAQPV